MKKLLLAIAAVVMLASCAKDDIQLETKQATVSFNVTSPAVATRYGEGTTATKLYWATYDEEEGLISGLCGDKEFSLNTNVELSLVQGRSYEVIFWAQAEDAPFTRTWGNVATEAQITINDMANLTANKESYDAFFGYIDLGEVSGSTLHDVDLVRPFAQLNVATADITKAENADLDVARTGIEVTGVYSSLRLFDGAVLGDRTTAKFALAKKAEGKVKTNGKEYDYLSMNYLLVKEKALVDVKLSLQDSEANVKVLTRNYTSVPVQRNYRTNIVGNILTSDTEFSIEVKPGFEEDGFGVIDGKIFQYVNNAAEFFAALDNTEVEIIILTEDIDLNNQAADVASRAGEDLRQVVIPADRTVTIDLNGKTLSQTKRQTSAYSMITNDGNLTIIDGKQGGKISYTDTGNGGTYESNTITNRGTITIKSGTIENLSSVAVGQNGYPYVIDTSIWGSAQEVVVNVEGGKLYSEGYNAIRVRIDSEKPVTANVSGGEIIGTIEVQMASATDGIVGSLNVSGGKISNNAMPNTIYIFGLNGDASNINVAISDGEIIGRIYVRESIGTGFNRQFITGGTFHDASALNYLADGAEIKLGDDMELAADATITFPAEQSFTIDLNEKTLSGHSTTTGKNYNMFDVRGTLSVKNGNITYKHTGENMAYNNFAEIFYVGFSGALELDGVTAKNLGGSDMAYVVDMANATDITVNVNNSALESTYIPVRVFNNTTGVNNVTIKDSSLAGKYCFWVQYWLADGRDEETLQNTVKLDIFNTEGEDSNNNTFTYNNKYDAPVLFGDSKYTFYNELGEALGNNIVSVKNAEEFQAALDNLPDGTTTIFLTDKIEHDEPIVITEKVGVDIIIDGKGNQYDGQIKIKGNSNHTSATMVIKNINFTTSTESREFIWSADSQNGSTWRYANNITISNCTFTASGDAVQTAIGIKFQQAYNIQVNGCTATNMHTLLQAESCGTRVSVDRAKVISGKHGVSFNNTMEAIITNSNIEAVSDGSYGVRAKGEMKNYSLYVKDCEIKAFVPVLVRNMIGESYTATFEGNNIFTAANSSVSKYQVVFCSGDYDNETPPVEPTGNYNVSGLDGFTVYPENN